MAKVNRFAFFVISGVTKKCDLLMFHPCCTVRSETAQFQVSFCYIIFSIVTLFRVTKRVFHYTLWFLQFGLSWGCMFTNGVSVVNRLQPILCPKLNDGSALVMRSRYLILNTDYTTVWVMLFSSAKMRCHETSPSDVNNLGILECMEANDMFECFRVHHSSFQWYVRGCVQILYLILC